MEKWIKYINSLSENDKNRIFEIAKKIFENNLSWLDIKSIKWRNYLYRCRVGKFRILFTSKNWNINIIACDTRWDVYKWV